MISKEEAEYVKSMWHHTRAEIPPLLDLVEVNVRYMTKKRWADNSPSDQYDLASTLLLLQYVIHKGPL